MKKNLGVLLILLTIFSCLVGCEYFAPKHEHEFSPSYDETGHFQKCPCGEITDKAEHSLEWVMDVEPSYTAPGYKKERCCLCLYETGEIIQIERLLDENVNMEAIVDPSLGTYKKFKTSDDLCEYLEDNKSKLNKTFLCFDATSDAEKGLYVWEDMTFQYNYLFDYAEETDKEFVNPVVVVNAHVYSSELGSATDASGMDGFASSIVFLMKFYEFDGDIKNYKYVFQKYDNPDSAMDYVINIYSGLKCVGKIYYSDETENGVDREWIVNYIEEGLFTL